MASTAVAPAVSGMFASERKRDVSSFPLDERMLLRLFAHPEQLEFVKSRTGIENEEELKVHFLSVQREAYAVRGVHPRSCRHVDAEPAAIRSFLTSVSVISHLPRKYTILLSPLGSFLGTKRACL